LSLKHLSLDDAEWHGFVRSRADATPFHHPAWASLLSDCYGLSGFVLALTDGAGSITAGIPLLAPPRLPGRPRRLVSLPFTDALDPLVAPGEGPLLAASIDAARRELGVARIELRGAMEGARPSELHAVIHRLALDIDPDLILAGFSKGKRRDVRASQHKNLTTRRAETERDLTEIYYRLHLGTRRRLGVPSQPKRFFRLLWERIIEPGHGFVLIVQEGRIPVASAVFLVGNGTIVYKYSASDVNRRGENPNVLLVWSAIRDACEEGLTTFDFGRSELFATGLRYFKTGWGALEEPLVYSSIGEGESGDSGTPGIIGNVLRRSPTWVTRISGELLYRFVA
jgi:CelD/BcsL family acetyltransferase involved in cellulose biosynthesis